MENTGTDDLETLRKRLLKKFARFADNANRECLEYLEKTIDAGRPKIEPSRRLRARKAKRRHAGDRINRRTPDVVTVPEIRYPVVDKQPSGDPEFERAQSEGPRHSPHEGHLHNRTLFQTNVVSATEMAEIMGMSKPPLLERARDGRVIGWQDARGQWRFPKAQLDSYGRVLTGISEVRAEFDDPMHAWWWLNEPNRDIGGNPPLQGLRDGRAVDVIQSAQSFALGAFS